MSLLLLLVSLGHCNMLALTGTSFFHSECGITCMSRVYKISVSHLLARCNLAVMGPAGSMYAAATSVNVGINTHRMRKISRTAFGIFMIQKHSFDENIQAYWQCTHNSDLNNTFLQLHAAYTKQVLWAMVDNWTVGFKWVTNGTVLLDLKSLYFAHSEDHY